MGKQRKAGGPFDPITCSYFLAGPLDQLVDAKKGLKHKAHLNASCKINNDHMLATRQEEAPLIVTTKSPCGPKVK